MPDGLRAAPRRAIRMFFAERLSSNWTNSNGFHFQNLHTDRVPWPWWAMDWVANAWGHHGPFKAATCGGQLAQGCQLFCTHRFGFVAGRPSSDATSANKDDHSPHANRLNLSSNLSLWTIPPRAGWNSNIFGMRKNNFQPRSSCTTFRRCLPSIIASKANCTAPLYAPLIVNGTDLTVCGRLWNSSDKSTPSKASKPKLTNLGLASMGIASSTDSPCPRSESGRLSPTRHRRKLRNRQW